MDEPTRRRLAESRQRSLGSIRRAIATVTRVIRMNKRMEEDHPSHRESAQRRIQEGHQELATLERERAELETHATDGAPPAPPDGP
jgi:hypothetical protein